MTKNDDRVDQIVEELLAKRLSKEERIARFRELVRRERSAPDELLDRALERLMHRLGHEER